MKSSAIYTPNVQDSENGRVVTIVTEDKTGFRSMQEQQKGLRI